MIRFLHIADTHFKRFDYKDALKSQDFINTYAKTNKANLDFLVNAGDIWDHSVVNNDKTSFTQVIRYYKDLSKHVPVLMIKGNHDPAGSLKIFNEITDNRILAIEDYFNIVVLTAGGFLFTLDAYVTTKNQDPVKCVFFTIPFPEKHTYVTGSENNTKDGNLDTLIDSEIRKLLIIGNNETSSYNCPKIVVFHGSIQNYKRHDGYLAPAADFNISVETLNCISPNYVACGHIHLYQTFAPKYPQTCYSGSTWPVSFQETDDKFMCDVTLDTTNCDIQKIKIPVVKKITHKLSIEDEDNLNTALGLYEKLKKNKTDLIRVVINVYDHYKNQVKVFKPTENMKVEINIKKYSKNKNLVEKISKLHTIEDEINFFFEHKNLKPNNNVSNIIIEAYKKVKENQNVT